MKTPWWLGQILIKVSYFCIWSVQEDFLCLILFLVLKMPYRISDICRLQQHIHRFRNWKIYISFSWIQHLGFDLGDCSHEYLTSLFLSYLGLWRCSISFSIELSDQLGILLPFLVSFGILGGRNPVEGKSCHRQDFHLLVNCKGSGQLS